MAFRNILQAGDPALTKVCRSVETFDVKLAQLIDDMFETMREANGVGLAASQVGVLRRVVTIELDGARIELVNPEITGSEGLQEDVEGCLSFTGQYGITRRPMKVRVKAQDRNGKWHIYTGEGLKARCFCHEIDHLNGILFKRHVIRMLDPEEIGK